jgi:hypothetical protein
VADPDEQDIHDPEYRHYCKQVERIDRLVEEGAIHARQLDILVEKIAGPLILDPYTGVPTGERGDGIADKVKILEHRSNGGSGFSISAKDKTQIVAWVTIVGTAVGTIISQLP